MTLSLFRDRRERLDTLRAKGLGYTEWEPWTDAQVAPEGEWDGWLFLAGRGTGKTDAGANYVVEHVKGPPCIKGPQPHRIGIIAPTKDDARQACIEGETGIKRHDIGAYTYGQNEVRWPNGSVAPIFGAYRKEDVERLRAGGNRSIAVGTPIETEEGPRPIETIRPGDLVFTAAGLRPVLGSWNHGLRPLWRITTERGHELILTPDHKVWTPEGWKRCDSLHVGSSIATWNGAVTAGSFSATDTGRAVLSAMADRPLCSCTELSGSNTTGQSQTDGTSTTETATSKTIDLATSSPLIHQLITQPTQRSSHQSGTRLVVDRPNGIQYQPGHAGNVALISRDTARRGSALGVAGAHINQRKHQPKACDHAWCVEAISTVPAGPPPSLVPDRVATISPGNAEGPVWDLTVAGEHAFVADGIYVANCLVWMEELAAWPQLVAAYDQMEFGLRSGPSPHWIATTTGKPRKLLKDLLKDPDVVRTTARTIDNPHLPEKRREKLLKRYGGTRVGRQELDGEIVDDVPGAIWSMDEIIVDRDVPLHALEEDLPPYVVEMEDGTFEYNFDAVVVAVDPPGGATEAGIVAVGRLRIGRTDHFYVLADRSAKLSPNAWARAAIDLNTEYQADAIIGEINYGGDMVMTIVGNNIQPEDGHVARDTVRATRGKKRRAQPVHDLYEQHRVHHLGKFERLEEEMTTWVPEDSPEPHPGDEDDVEEIEASDWSPNRMDALVWAVTYLADFNEPRAWVA